MLKEILSDLLSIDDILFVVKSNGATAEIRSNSLGIRQKDQWITIGENDGPCHMHLNDTLVRSAQFVREEKPERTSFSVRFYDEKGERILGVFFTKMYDEKMNLKQDRKKLYDALSQKYGTEMIYFTE
ncbi:MAG: hypothetical protein DWQ18_01665 [Crenarchaeota archaeon]|mgnify:CR=1 FL=1|nr:MAG: hypothetical protein DWQ17_06865 [Thermoproteota archaeon]RDJ33663.1 MAG: hypothetical protein DWQ18_01665 [Thermoproteota archaeon]RDJ37241.1 MAG: hypothetical protein DWQ19_01875 [Thermoproteota archaeon]RDJ39195.1 MAG: hypothetical protein DWQ13_02765 [Thermoproteota archaeon]